MRHFLLLILLAFSLQPLTSSAQGTWQPRNPLPTAGRLGSYAFVVNGVVYMGGGDTPNGGGSTNDLWAYNPLTDAWTPRANLPGPSRAAATTFVIGSTAYVVAGEQATSSGGITDLNDAWAYNAATNVWTSLAPLPGTGRVGAYGFAIGGKGYVGGGGNFVNTTQLTDCWVYDPATTQWSACPAPPVQAVTISADFALGDYGYLAGGINVDSLTNGASQQVWRFEAATNQWTRRADLPGPRAYAGRFTAGGYGYVAEGISNILTQSATHDLLRYDPTADTWTSLTPAPGAPGRIVPLCFALGTTAYLGQGQETSANGTVLNDLWQLPMLITGVPSVVSTAFTLAPNPAHHAVRLSGAPAGPVVLTDALGRLVRTATIVAGQSETALDMAGLPPGVYSVRCGAQTRLLMVE